MNNKLVTTDKARYYNIAKHDYEENMFTLVLDIFFPCSELTSNSISIAEAKDFSIAPALERIYPPWVRSG